VVQKLLLEEGLRRTKQYSVSVLGYDFIGLAMRLGLFLTVGVLIQAYFTATITGSSWLNIVAGFFNIKFPDTLPEWLTKLFTTGWNGIAFWQILQITAILLVIIEYMQYDRMLKEKDQKANATSQAVFLIIALALALLVVPETVQKFKEMKILSKALKRHELT